LKPLKLKIGYSASITQRRGAAAIDTRKLISQQITKPQPSVAIASA